MPDSIQVLLKNCADRAAEVPEVYEDAKNPNALEDLMANFDASKAFICHAALIRVAQDIMTLDELSDCRSAHGAARHAIATASAGLSGGRARKHVVPRRCRRGYADQEFHEGLDAG